MASLLHRLYAASLHVYCDRPERKKMTGYSKKKKRKHASAAPCRDGKVTAGQYSSAPDTKGTHMRMQTMTPDIGDATWTMQPLTTQAVGGETTTVSGAISFARTRWLY